MRTILFVTIDPIEHRRKLLDAISVARQAGYKTETISLSEDRNKQNTSDIKYIYIPFKSGPSKFIMFNLILFLKIIFKKYDVIHMRGLWVLPAIIKRQFFNRSRLIYDAHEFFAGHEIFQTPSIPRSIWLGIEKMAIPFISHLITVSEPLADFYKERYPNLKKISVIRNIPSLKQVVDFNSINDTKSKKYRTILFHGYFLKGRSLSQIINAMTFLRNLPVRLILVGQGPLKDELLRQVEESELQEVVEFHDFVAGEDLIQFLSRAYIGLSIIQADSINRKYALPNKFFELITAGVPVLASDIPTLKSYVEKYKVGRTVNPEDPQKIATAIKKMISEPEELLQMRKNCIFAAQSELNWETESTKLLSIYAEEK